MFEDFKCSFTFFEVIENTNFNNFTPLLIAAKYDQVQAFNTLVNVGADIQVCCTSLNNPLHYAVMNKSILIE